MAERYTSELDVVIVGAGFAGLYLVHRLRGLGYRVRAFDAASGVGGTWYWNRYPGARCDVRSLEYSFSFDPDLEQEWEWSEKFATQPEILRYANHIADRYDLRPDIQLDTRVESQTWDDARSRWTVKTDAGDVIDAQHVVLAVGTLSTPKLPEIPGIEDFAGEWYQTQKFPETGVSFLNKRVAVIGTGSSAIQAIPEIAKTCKQLTVFQRTPNFSFPAGNRPLLRQEVDEAKARYPELRQGARQSFFGQNGDEATQSALDVSPEERRRRYQAGWDAGQLVGVLGAFSDTLTNKESNDTVAEFLREKIREIVKDPETAEALCPYNHPVGTKRPCLDTGYYNTFNMPHVRLVDLRKTPIERITPRGIDTAAESMEFDVIVYATGFDAMTGSILKIDIRGRAGRSLADAWRDGPVTYLGLMVAGFPNLFTVTGPQSPSVLSNMMVSIEQHVDWITDCIEHLRRHGLGAIEATPEAQQDWVQHTNEVAAETLYPLANSWYMGANVPGKPRVFLPYIGGVGVYREKCDEVAREGYQGFALSG
jgi:cyclohexanone monooxygenase